ncbi:MAG: type 4a pilus biogenesis protein PilO [Candidatus Omnitrophica bacterium]|nr:type 4a pilus biogenesis protein PilO [Candidatus Omnitrophota bacterium]MBU1926057.1 type 4a pilus biogenesis protein PilO [Candidatus Omnitrophota bacterium]
MLKGLFKKFSKREKIALSLAVLIVIITFLDRLILNPIINKMKSLKVEVGMLEGEINKNIRILSQRERVERTEKKYAPYAVQASSDEEETANLLKLIENMSQQTSVYIMDLKPAGVTKEAAVKKFMVNIGCEGEMEEILSFMYEIEDADQLLSIGAFTINPKARQSSVVRCQLLIYKVVVL